MSVEFLSFVKLSLTAKTLKCQLTYCDSKTCAISLAAASSAHNRGRGAGITERGRGREREGMRRVLLWLAERQNFPFHFLLEQSCQPASYFIPLQIKTNNMTSSHSLYLSIFFWSSYETYRLPFHHGPLFPNQVLINMVVHPSELKNVF